MSRFAQLSMEEFQLVPLTPEQQAEHESDFELLKDTYQFAVETLAEVFKYKGVLMSGNSSPTGIDLSYMAIKYRTRQLGIEIPDYRKNFANESIDLNDRKLALEGAFVDIVRKIIDAIVKAFKQLWDAVTSIFRSEQGDEKKEEVKTKKMLEDTKRIVETAATNVAAVTDQGFIEDPYLVGIFRQYDGTITGKQIEEWINNCQRNLTFFKGLVNAGEQVTNAISNGTNALLDLSFLNEHPPISEKAAEIGTFIKSTINQYIEGNIPKLTNLPGWVKRNLDSSEFVHGKTYGFDGYAKGAGVYFMMPQDVAFEKYDCVVVRELADEPKCKLKFPTVQELERLSKIVAEYRVSVADFMPDFYSKMESMQATTRMFTNNMARIQELDPTAAIGNRSFNVDEFNELIKLINQISMYYKDMIVYLNLIKSVVRENGRMMYLLIDLANKKYLPQS